MVPPERRPSSRAHMPVQLTTTSQAMSPRSVTTPVTRPSARRTPLTAVGSQVRAPPRRAAGAGAGHGDLPADRRPALLGRGQEDGPGRAESCALAGQPLELGEQLRAVLG